MNTLGLVDAKFTETALVVRIAGKLYAIPIAAIEEVLPALAIEPIPECPRFVRGVVYVRGQVIPVLSAAERLGMTDYVRPDEPNIVCLRLDDRIVGVEFDETLDLVHISGDESLEAEKMGVGKGFFTGVIDHEGEIIRLLDPDKLVNETEAAALESVPNTA